MLYWASGDPESECNPVLLRSAGRRSGRRRGVSEGSEVKEDVADVRLITADHCND